MTLSKRSYQRPQRPLQSLQHLAGPLARLEAGEEGQLMEKLALLRRAEVSYSNLRTSEMKMPIWHLGPFPHNSSSITFNPIGFGRVKAGGGLG